MSMSLVLDAIATPRRREILRLVWTRELPAGEVHRAMPDVSFGAISQHLRVLEGAGLVTARREGRHRYYAARPENLGELKAWLEHMWSDALHRLKVRAEIEHARRGPGKRSRR